MRKSVVNTLAIGVLFAAYCITEAWADGGDEDARPDVREFPEEFEAPVMRTWRGGLHPVYFPMMSFFSPAMMLAYFFREGVLASTIFSLLFLAILTFIYQFTWMGHDGSYVRMWQYPIVNPDSILSNKGAVGGFYCLIGYFGTVLFGGFLGDSASWSGFDTTSGGLPNGKGTVFSPRQRTFNAASMIATFRRGCGGFICPTKINDEDNADAPPAAAFSATKGGKPHTFKGDDTDTYQSTCCNAMTAVTGGQKVTFGVLWDVLLIVMMVGLVVGPIRDVMRAENILYDWFTLLVLLGVYAIVWIWYQPYQYGEMVDYPAWKWGPTDHSVPSTIDPELRQHLYIANNMKIYLRYYDKFHILYPIFTYVFISQLGFCIFSSVMWGMHALESAQFAQDAAEARWLVRQNITKEFVTVIIITVILAFPTIIGYCLFIKGVIKKPSPMPKKSAESVKGNE